MVTSFTIALSLVVCQPNSLADGDELVNTHLAGMVRGADDKPISGATVRLTGTFGYRGPFTGKSNQVTTDAEGRYRLGFATKPDGTVEVLGVAVDSQGYVRVDARFGAVRPVMRPAGTTELNFVLVRGEILAGRVDAPERLRDRLEDRKREPRGIHAIRVRGAGFSQVYVTEPGGQFEVWVPPGTYDLELLSPLPGEPTDTVLKGMKSGTRGLELKKVDAPVATEVLAGAFDALWDDMDRNYSYFELKHIDWLAMKVKYRPRAVAALSLPEFVDIVGEMLGELDDGHIWFVAPADAVVARKAVEHRIDGNAAATESTIRNLVRVGESFVVGTTGDEEFAVIRVTRQSQATEWDVSRVVEFIRTHAEAPGFVIDLRGANGGNEMLARRIAREFCANDTVYARSKYRDGPKASDFGKTYDRILEKSNTPYTKPVVCVLGPGCVSSREGFAKMLSCLPHVTTVGLPTRGSSGNPKPFELPGVPITIMYSRWVDMMPDGTPIEGRGVPPRVVVDVPATAYEQDDPTWKKAIDVLRENTRARL